MRNLITIALLAASLLVGWQYQELSGAKTATEAKIEEMSAETEKLKASLRTANARIVQLTAPAHGQADWIADRNRNWQSPLTATTTSPGSNGKNRQHGTMPTPVPTPLPQ